MGEPMLSSRFGEKVFYPVFPPDENVLRVIGWLAEHPGAGD